MGSRVIRRKNVPLEGGECVKVWRQESYWNCRWVNRTCKVRELIGSHTPEIPSMHSEVFGFDAENSGEFQRNFK